MIKYAIQIPNLSMKIRSCCSFKIIYHPKYYYTKILFYCRFESMKKKPSILIVYGIIILIVIIILVVCFCNSKTSREHTATWSPAGATAKRRLGESGPNYVQWGNRVHLQNQSINYLGNRTYLDVCRSCNCQCGNSDGSCAKGLNNICDSGCLCGKSQAPGAPPKQDVSTVDVSIAETDGDSWTWTFGKQSSKNLMYPDYIVYGDLIHVYSAWEEWYPPEIGYLEACGSCIGAGEKNAWRAYWGTPRYGCACKENQNVYDVRIESETPRGVRSEIWKIISATGIPEGKFIEYNADIYLENQMEVLESQMAKTFLDACGGCNNEDKVSSTLKCAGPSGSRCRANSRLDVSTSYTPTREKGSGTWRIIKADEED